MGQHKPPVVVTSDRLGHETVGNRMFPKVRSWFALGAPLELLSPLSVARILVIFAAGTWAAGAVLGTFDTVAAAILLVVSVATVGALMRLRFLPLDASTALAAGLTAMIAVALFTSDDARRVVTLALLLAVMSIFIGLFFVSFRLVGMLVILCGVIVLSSRMTNEGMGFSDGVITSTFVAGLAMMTAFTARTSRVSGSNDPETGVKNITAMTSELDRRDRNGDVIVATVFLSGVEEVRDALGHDAGLGLVRRAIEDLGQVLPSTSVIGRGAGNDVLVLMWNESDASTDDLVCTTVRQISDAIGVGRYLVGDIEVALATHVGIAIAKPLEIEAGELVRQSALAARSARGRGQVSAAWDGRTTTLTVEDLAILSNLRRAIAREELWIAYQPQVRATDERIVAVEALLRWSSAQHGFVSPGRFIPLAERTGLVDRLTDWVIAEALDAQVRWREAGIEITVSVNVSPLSLRSIDFGERVLAALDSRALSPEVLMLEVTESAAFDIPEAVERLAPLRAIGVKISIDDFGTGYTSLAVLPHLPLDEIKVDQQFVRGSVSSTVSEAIVVSVCELAHRLGLSVVAEGVEDEPLAASMGAIGFDLLQGYHFARPMPETELVEMLTEAKHLESAGLVVADPLCPSASQPLAGTIARHAIEVGSLG